MVDIIKEGKTLNVTKCNTCLSLIRFSEEEVRFHCDPWYFFGLYLSRYLYLNCPRCGGELHISSVEVGVAPFKQLCEKFGYKP